MGRSPSLLSLGHFEQLLLMALVRLKDNAYGIALRNEIDEETGRSVSLGMVYKALWRLERKGLVSSHLGEPTARRGGRRKRLYEISPAGREALRMSLDAVRRLSRGIDRSLAKR